WAEEYLGHSFLPHSAPPTPHAWSEAFVAAGEEFGLRVESPLTSSLSNTCGLFAVAQRGGERQHSGQHLESLDNLQIYGEASVERIGLCSGRAVAATIQSTAGRCLLRATREIVLCVGTIGSPQILW